MTWLKEFIYCFYLNRFDPTLEQSQLAIKSCLALGLTLTFALIYPNVSMLWLILSNILLMQTYRGNSRKRRTQTIILSSAALLLGTLIAGIADHSLVALCSFGFVAAFITFYLSSYGKDIFIPAMLILLMLIITVSKVATPPELSQRLFSTGIAAIIAIAVSTLLWPYQPKKLIAARLALAANYLRNYSKWMLLDHICGTHTSHYCNDLRMRCFDNLHQCRKLLNNHPNGQQIERWRLLLRMYGSLVAISHLLDEPSSSSSFNKITTELKATQQRLFEAFAQLNSKQHDSPGVPIRTLAEHVLANSQHNEDLISYAFILERMSDQFKEYHALPTNQ